MNESEFEWVVQREDGRVVAHPDSARRSASGGSPAFDTTAELTHAITSGVPHAKVDDGWIVGYDAGEFGGTVYWFDKAGMKKRRLSDYQIQQFLVDGKRLFAVESRGHMTSGSMVELRKDGEKWLCEEFVCLPEAGKCIARVAFGDYVIVTSSMLLRVNLKREIIVLIPRGGWFNANSVALGDDGFVYIGSRHLVVAM